MHSYIRRSVLPAVVATALAITLSVPAANATTSLPSIPDPGQEEATLAPRSGAGTPSVRGATGIEPPSTSARTSTESRTAAASGAPVVWLHTLEPTTASFSWSAGTGDSPTTGYILRLTSGGVVLFEVAWGTDAQVDVIDLDPEATYEFSVAAVNAQGTGEFSDAYAFTTPFDFVERQFGRDRYETAARVSYRAFPFYGIPAAFVANGLNFPDALSAAAAAGTFGGPVLLTDAKKLPPAVASELAALQPDYVVVAGGPSLVSDAVWAQAAASATIDSFRLYGSNRYGTAAEVAWLWDSADVVYLASGKDFPDALAGAAAAAFNEMPVLLTDPTTLPPETRAELERLKPSKIVVLGGAGAVSDAVVQSARAATGVATSAQRLAGAGRYETAVEISRATFPAAGVPVVYVASGRSFADALAGAAAAGYRGGPVLLTDPAAAPTVVRDEIARLQPERIIVLGGPSVVSDLVMTQLYEAAH